MACSAILLCFLAISPCFYGLMGEPPHSKKPRRLLLDTDMDTDDFFALLYLLKQNRSEFDLKVSFSFSVFSFTYFLRMLLRLVLLDQMRGYISDDLALWKYN